MPTLFDNAKFGEYKSTYVAPPIEQFAKTATILNDRWEQNKDAKDQLDIAMSNMKVEDADNPIVKARTAKIREAFKGTVDKNDFENAGNTVKTAFKDLGMDNSLKAATTNYGIRQETKKELKDRYDKKMLSKTQYDDRIRKFSNYQGIGAPDDLGFYDDYTFDFGASRVDLNAFANDALSKYTADTNTSSGSVINYKGGPGGVEASVGIGDSRSSGSVKISNGAKGRLVLENQMKNDPNVMAYVNDEVRIHNEMNPDKPISINAYITDYASDYVKQYDHVDTASDISQLADRDDFRRSRVGKEVSDGYRGIENIPTEGQDPYAHENIKDYAMQAMADKDNPKSNDLTTWGGLWNGAKGLFKTKLTTAQQTQYSNLLTMYKGDVDKVANYLANTEKLGVINTYKSYDNPTSEATTKQIERNLASRTIYNVETGEVISGDQFVALVNTKKADKKMPDFKIVGRAAGNNTYLDLTNDEVFAKPYMATVDGKHYAIGLAQDEMLTENPDNITYNQLTQAYRSGIPAFMNSPATKQSFRIETGVELGKRVFKVYDNNTNKSYGMIEDTGKEKEVADAFKSLINYK
jgi:hypothetical protein